MTAKINKKNKSTKKNTIKNTRSTKFYTAQFGYSTRYFSKLFLKASNGISALNYIENKKPLGLVDSRAFLLKKVAASYSPALHCSTIGASGLNFSVRNGKRWDPAAITT